MAVKNMIHVLLVYNHAQGKLVDCQTFEDAHAATEAYATAELGNDSKSGEFEVVLVGSDSIDTIHKTHGHYFPTRGVASKYLDVADVD